MDSRKGCTKCGASCFTGTQSKGKDIDVLNQTTTIPWRQGSESIILTFKCRAFKDMVAWAGKSLFKCPVLLGV
jgi:hypothetical protein